MADTDDVLALLKLRDTIARGLRDTGLGPPRTRHLKPELATTLGAEANIAPYSLFDPDTWDGHDAMVQALIDGSTARRREMRTARYYDVIGHAPVCRPGEIGMARVYLAKIMKAIEIGGWTRGEYLGLKRLQYVWEPRATGRDVRFMIVGTYPHRLTMAQERRIRELQFAQRRGVL
jgi:hypothetical protein